MPFRLPAASLAQTLLGIAALFLLALWPPQRGPMLLVPWRGNSADTINAAAAGHARLLGEGPFWGSMVVFGDQAKIRAAIANKAFIIMAAPPAGCGNFADDGRTA